MSILRRDPSSWAAPPLEDEDLLAEILLRLSPQPSSLPRASSVCKLLRSIASDPGFSRRFRRHHRRNPPLLGFFDTYYGHNFLPTADAPNRVPPGRFSSQWPHDDRGEHLPPLGCRHGLVLMLDPMRKQVLVWDPLTGEHHRVDLPSRLDVEETLTNGAVLRVAGDVHHFQVVMVVARNGDELPRQVRACVYSSENGVWGDLISTLLPLEYLSGMRAVLVGDFLYWKLVGNCVGILEFDLERQSLAVIQVPAIESTRHKSFTVMRAECGGLGFLFVSKSDLSAQLWKRTTDCYGVASWVLGRTIELAKLLSLDLKTDRWPLHILGFAEHNNVMVLLTNTGTFMVQLESLQFKKLLPTNKYSYHHPFESVYAAGI